jgi:hypothetical protein
LPHAGYRPASKTLDVSINTPQFSAGFAGTAYAEAPAGPDLNLTGDWTVELWFKDENPNGFNHDYVTLLNKGDRGTSGEAPYFVSLGFKQLLVGERAGFADYALTYNLFQGGVDPARWHHLAATFQATTRTLVLYLDGTQVATGVLGQRSAGNTLPVELGRNGPSSGKNFTGKLDDVRLWNVVRSAAQIQSNFGSELVGPQPGLVANWKFDDGPTSAVALDSAGGHTATLHGVTSSPPVHP